MHIDQKLQAELDQISNRVAHGIVNTPDIHPSEFIDGLNLDTLNMSSDRKCAIGQLRRSYVLWATELDFTFSHDPCDLGIHVPPSVHDRQVLVYYEYLTREWCRKISALRRVRQVLAH